MALDAVKIYLEFAHRYPNLAEAQPVAHFPATLLWTASDCPLAVELAEVAAILDTDASSIACAALNVYFQWRGGRKEHYLIDVENIRFELSRAGNGARRAARKAIMRAIGEPLSDSAMEFADIRDLVAMHPGLRETSKALTMMLAGYYQLCDGELSAASVAPKGGAK
jgi:hypothetical protein